MAESQFDEMVAKVQQWLIANYWQQIGSFEVTGRTGWSTMYALTRALQFELGISALSNNFGDGTLAALTSQYPRIGQGSGYSRIAQIIQGGLYCKGYNPSGFDGYFGNGCTSAIKAIQTDMGLTVDGQVTPKLFKGLLTMDAYVLLPGGTASARTVQQWLNRTYLGRKNFFVMPCDGLYSRNTQKALVYALQYEIGMNDTTANGTFGPGTRDGVRVHGGFEVGASDSTKNWIRLFHAAMIFNKFPVTFDASYSTADATQVRAFQDFCKLGATGGVDYRTWCSLLVSNGDPTRPGTACDTRVRITSAFASWLVSNGYQTVGRYLTNARVANPLDKEIKPGELATIHAAGLSVFPIYQEVGSSAGNFSYWAGYEAAHRADEAARRHGIPAGTTIYFAVDFDPTDDQIASAVVPHFRGIQDAMRTRGNRFSVGSYGTRNVCQSLAVKGLSKFSFVAGMSTGFSGNLGYTLPTNWAFDQVFESTPVTGLPLDKNIASGRDAGFSTTVAPSVSQNAELHRYLVWLEGLAAEYLRQNPFKSDSLALLVTQRMRRAYNGIQWDLLAGIMDDDWIDFVKTRESAAGFSGVPQYIDPMRTAGKKNWDPAHLFVTLEVYMRRGIAIHKDSPYTEDLLGWAGDLLSVLNAYQGAVNDYGYTGTVVDFAELTLLSNVEKEPYTVNFWFEDACQDADAYNIAFEYSKDPSGSFADLAFRHIDTGGPSAGRNRFRAFVEDRFKTTAFFKYAARQALLATPVLPDPVYVAESAVFLTMGEPASTVMENFTAGDLTAVADLFTTKITARM